MGMIEWAKREVEIACKRERGNKDENEWDYGCACYESALKAFNSLMEDGHSGFSIGITKQILMRLLDRKPLTPITDTEDEWFDITDETGESDCKKYRSRRMCSLTKKVYKDRIVKYSDVNRFNFYDLNANPNIGFFSGCAAPVIDEMFPIKMPYIPENKPIKVYTREFLTDRKNDDFDTVAILYAIFPDGERKEINRYFKEVEKGWKEIDINEYTERVHIYYNKEIAE